MNAPLDPARRDFLKKASLTAAGLVIAFHVPARRRAWAAEPPAEPAGSKPVALPPANAFLRIGTDDTVTVLLAHSEMGQGIWTSLPMLIAEELDADWSTIRVEHAPAAPVYAHTAYGAQMTGGSTTTWSEFDRYRQVGAAARTLLVQAAAQRLGVAPSACRSENGAVVAGDRRLRYGELAAEAAKLPMPETVALKDPKDWKIIGRPTRRLDTPEKIDGRAAVRPRRAARRAAHRRGRAQPHVRRPREVLRRHGGARRTGRAQGRPGAERRRRRRRPLLGRAVRTRGAQGRVGHRRRSARGHAGPAGRVPPAGGHPGQDRGRSGRRARGAGHREAHGRRRVRPALPRARADGAAQLHRADRAGQLRDLDGHAVPDHGPAGGGANHGSQARANTAPHDLPRRRIRSASDAGLRLGERGRARGEGCRRAGEDRMDARGRRARRLLPADVPAPCAYRAGRRRPAGGLGPRHRRAVRARGLTVRIELRGHRRGSQLGRRRVGFTVPQGNREPPRATARLPLAGAGAVVALRRPQPHGLRDGEPRRRAGTGRRHRRRRVPPPAARRSPAPPRRARPGRRGKPAGADRCPRAGRAASPCTSPSAASWRRWPRSPSRPVASASTA